MNNKKYSIYKISSQFSDKIYIGSTSLKLNNRLHLHKSNFKRYLNGYCNYVMSFDLIKLGECKIELIEEVNDENKLDREKYHIKNNLDKVNNKYIPNRNNKEYYQDNKEIIKQKRKEYYINNKDKVNESKRNYYELNKDKINEKRRNKRREKKLLKATS